MSLLHVFRNLVLIRSTQSKSQVCWVFVQLDVLVYRFLHLLCWILFVLFHWILCISPVSIHELTRLHSLVVLWSTAKISSAIDRDGHVLGIGQLRRCMAFIVGSVFRLHAYLWLRGSMYLYFVQFLYLLRWILFVLFHWILCISPVSIHELTRLHSLVVLWSTTLM